MTPRKPVPSRHRRGAGFQDSSVIRLLNGQFLGMEIDPEEAYEILDAIDSVIIGDPDTCLAKLRKFEAVGVDRLLALQQLGGLSHEHVLRSTRLIGEELLPQFGS